MQTANTTTVEVRPASVHVAEARRAMDKLEELAAWHRLQAELAGSVWVWEARVRTAEELERQAADIRKRLSTDRSEQGLRQPLQLAKGVAD
jgi:phage baseplate assembly protein W